MFHGSILQIASCMVVREHKSRAAIRLGCIGQSSVGLVSDEK